VSVPETTVIRLGPALPGTDHGKGAVIAINVSLETFL
jgi:hypothetical protein